MGGMVQSVDLDVQMNGANAELPEVLSVVDCEVERVFGGGGSKATIEVVFDELLTSEQIEGFQSGVDGDEDNDLYKREQEIEVQVDVAVTNHTPRETETHQERLFTGSAIKVVENNERIVTIHALDYRHQLNRNMVRLDTTEDGVPTTEIVRNILTGEGSVGDGLGLTEGVDFFIDLGNSEPNTRINESWGVESHVTAFQVLQELAYEEAATLHIDAYNHVYFVKYPNHTEWGSRNMPPIIEWESGDEETEEDVIVESEWDESGIGAYTPMTSQPNREGPPGETNVGEEMRVNNVFSREAIEKVRASERIDNLLTKDSGVLHTVGDPRLKPYDQFDMGSDVVDGFAPINEGMYMSKTIRHMISGEDGYLVEIELGDDPEEMLKSFAGTASGVIYDEWGDEMSESAEEEEDSSFFSFIPGID